MRNELLKTFNDSFQQVKGTCKDYCDKLSLQEKGFIGVLILVIFIAAVHKIGNTVSDTLQDQEKRLEAVEQLRRTVPYRLANYMLLDGKKKKLEDEYNALRIQGSDDLRSDLETLLQNKSHIQRNFIIKPLATQDFARHFQQLPFELTFNIADYKELIDLLEEFNTGKNHFIIKSIFMKTLRAGRDLNVKLDLVGLKRKSA